MHTNLLMRANAFTLGLVGCSLSFLPREIADIMSLQSDPILLQLLGALYFGFALLNWMNKGKILGGIYGRPIVMANFAHFLIGAFALIKYALKGTDSNVLLILTSVYVIFGMAFGWMAFTHPSIKETNN